MACRTRRSPAGLRCARRSSGNGGDDFANSASPVCRTNRGRVARGAFPPEEVAQVKAIACELPKTHGVPLSRFSRSELHRFVVEQAISYASASTIGRWLADDAIKPWQQRSWIFPRDPKFLEKAGPILDLYEGRWEGKLREPGDCVISADAKPSIQARARIHPGAPPARGRGQLVEHGVQAARRVFWIVDNGSDHRGQKSIDRLQGRWPNLILVHTPVHGSWLNQVEIYHSIIQRKVLDPNDFHDTAAVARALNDFEHHYNQIAQPFTWNFTRAALAALIDRLDQPAETPPIPLAA